MKKSASFILIAVIALVFSACKDEPKAAAGTVLIDIEHHFSGQAMQLEKNYQNFANETFKLSTVKYYLSNVELVMSNGERWKESESYHLVDLSDSSSLQILLQDVPAGNYKEIKYLIGVDSSRNVSGSQTGALNPVHDMIWNWTMGYIFIKIEGRSSASPTGQFVYHIGGFSGANSALGQNKHSFVQSLPVNHELNASVNLTHDFYNFFANPDHQLLIGTLSNNIQSVNTESKLIADNFRAAFTIE